MLNTANVDTERREGETSHGQYFRILYELNEALLKDGILLPERIMTWHHLTLPARTWCSICNKIIGDSNNCKPGCDRKSRQAKLLTGE